MQIFWKYSSGSIQTRQKSLFFYEHFFRDFLLIWIVFEQQIYGDWNNHFCGKYP
jgi:hypothetical protein